MFFYVDSEVDSITIQLNFYPVAHPTIIRSGDTTMAQAKTEEEPFMAHGREGSCDVANAFCISFHYVFDCMRALVIPVSTCGKALL